LGFCKRKMEEWKRGREWSKGGKLELTLVKANTQVIA